MYHNRSKANKKMEINRNVYKIEFLLEFLKKSTETEKLYLVSLSTELEM